MLSHLDKSEREAVSILDSILIIIKQEYSIIQDHVHLIQVIWKKSLS